MINLDKINYDAFSHGQITSKQWLCEKLEPYISDNANLVILGSWYNILGLMLMVRNNKIYKSILGIDIDPESIEKANKLCNTWTVNDGVIKNVLGDANVFRVPENYIVINCSAEHMDSLQWFHNIAEGTLVCIQSSNIVDEAEPWLIKTPHPHVESMREKYKLSSVYYLDTLPIKYLNGWGYERYMIIGIK